MSHGLSIALLVLVVGLLAIHFIDIKKSGKQDG
ncbi:hypothetical protein ACVW2L_004301 [Mucilaginibacter sp. HD30]